MSVKEVPLSKADLTNILVPLVTDQDHMTVGFNTLADLRQRLPKMLANGWSINFARVRVQHCTFASGKFVWHDAPKDTAGVRAMLEKEFG